MREPARKHKPIVLDRNKMLSSYSRVMCAFGAVEDDVPARTGSKTHLDMQLLKNELAALFDEILR